MPRSSAVTVVVEVGARRTFASALDWPGWARSGRGEDAAVDTLVGYAARYAEVAARAGVAFPTRVAVEVAERLAGDASTDFGVPGKAAAAERAPLTPAEAKRRLSLVQAAWAVFDDVVAAAPATLRKGPRGGGRDRDAVAEHVRNAEDAYARKLAVPARHADVRGAIADVLGRRSDGAPLVAKGWPVRYAARRIAWHALDHAWEIQDRST